MLVAVCIASWMYSADAESRGVWSVGYPTVAFGRGVLRCIPPTSARVLLPFLLNWKTTEIPAGLQYGNGLWVSYQVARFALVWAALYLVAISAGLAPMLVAAGLFGLSLRYDYWSNTVELLAACFVLAGGALGWHWGYGLALGLVLGTGRETIPLLALVGTPIAVALGAGALVAHLAVRMAAKEPEGRIALWRQRIGYGWSGGASVKWNLGVLANGHILDRAGVAVFLLILLFAMPQQPILSLAVLAVMFLFAHMNEPRLATPLIPFAARQVCTLMS